MITKRELAEAAGVIALSTASIIGALTIATVTMVNTAPPCTEEDGSGQAVCVWDGQGSGNGVGRSYITLNQGQITIYFDNGQILIQP